MAAAGPSAGGPESSTAPPGSTVTVLPPGSRGSAAITSVSRSQPGRRWGRARSKQCASSSRPTFPTATVGEGVSGDMQRGSHRTGQLPHCRCVHRCGGERHSAIFDDATDKFALLVGCTSDSGCTQTVARLRPVYWPRVFCIAPASTFTAGPAVAGLTDFRL